MLVLVRVSFLFFMVISLCFKQRIKNLQRKATTLLPFCHFNPYVSVPIFFKNLKILFETGTGKPRGDVSDIVGHKRHCRVNVLKLCGKKSTDVFASAVDLLNLKQDRNSSRAVSFLVDFRKFTRFSV